MGMTDRAVEKPCEYRPALSVPRKSAMSWSRSIWMSISHLENPVNNELLLTEMYPEYCKRFQAFISYASQSRRAKFIPSKACKCASFVTVFTC